MWDFSDRSPILRLRIATWSSEDPPEGTSEVVAAEPSWAIPHGQQAAVVATN
jgi:hypothetical protein